MSCAFILLILTWAHGPAWQTKRGLAASGNSRTQPKLVCSSTFPFTYLLRNLHFTFPFASSPPVMSKKAPKNNEQETSYAEREIVLAKVRGFPPWPGMVCRVLFLLFKTLFIVFTLIGRKSRQCPAPRCQGATYWQEGCVSLCQIFPCRRLVRPHHPCILSG